jgi:hypothetical protein
MLESRCAVKRNGGHGHGDDNGNGVSADAPRARARYLTSSTPAANDAGPELVVLTAEQLVALVKSAVDEALAAAPLMLNAAPELLDRDGAAVALKCSRGQVDKMRRDGMPCRYVGDSPRFDYAECFEWLPKGRP